MDRWTKRVVEPHSMRLKNKTVKNHVIKNTRANAENGMEMQGTNKQLINTSHIIRRTGKKIKMDRKNAFSELKFDTEEAIIL